MAATHKWSAARLGNFLTRFTFNRGVLIVVPECYWAGHEADLLVVDSKTMKLIDVEIKISRADLKADVGKAKWWHRDLPYHDADGKWIDWHERQKIHTCLPEPRLWPPKIWKHYYCMPAEIWEPGLVDVIPKHSGILLVSGDPDDYNLVKSHRKAIANKEAKPITPQQALDIARLAGLRLWEAKQTIEDLLREKENQ